MSCAQTQVRRLKTVCSTLRAASGCEQHMKRRTVDWIPQMVGNMRYWVRRRNGGGCGGKYGTQQVAVGRSVDYLGPSHSSDIEYRWRLTHVFISREVLCLAAEEGGE